MSDWSQVGAQLAQIGLPSLGQLIGNMVVPVVGGAIGRSAGAVAASAVAAALGVEPEPQKVAEAIRADPSAAQVRLAQIDAESKQQLALLADMANARAMEIAAIQAGSRIQWVPVAFSVLNYILLFVGIVGVMKGWLREDGIIVGYVLGAATAAYQFWLGSTSSSRSKDATFQAIARTAAGSPAPPSLPVSRTGHDNASIIAKANKL